MMDKLIEEVTQCVEWEYSRASKNFGPTNHSDHESYAILLEEFDEAKFEMCTMEKLMSSFWNMVKWDEDYAVKCELLAKIRKTAIYGACELIQVAAMAKKALVTLHQEGVVKDIEEEGDK